MKNYMRISSYINNQEDINLKAWFYGLGNILLTRQFKDINIVTDRHLVSNYFWNSTEDNADLFKCLVDITGKPDLSILIYTSPDVRLQRILGRNAKDSDIDEIHLFPYAYEKMESFLKNNSMKYALLDSSELNLFEVVDEVIRIVKKELLFKL